MSALSLIAPPISHRCQCYLSRVSLYSGHPSLRFANTKDGNFAEYFHVNDAIANLTHIPASISDDVAVYACDMMSTGFMGDELPLFYYRHVACSTIMP